MSQFGMTPFAAPSIASVMPFIRIFSRDNNGGLARDLRLTADTLRDAGFEVEAVGFGKEKGLRNLKICTLWAARPWRGVADAQISLEHPYPLSYGLGRRDLLVPNPEWFRPHWHKALPRMDALLCKTAHAQRIFSDMAIDARFIGFTSEDRLDASVPRERVFLHVAGKSPIKGTEAVLEAWRRHPEWPPLVILQGSRYARPGPPAPNIEHRIGFVPDDELRRLQNACMFHLCPSEAEGFGHYLMEALSVGAVVATTDGEPMNELVSDGCGLLVAPARSSPFGLATRFTVDADGIEDVVARMLDLSATQCVAFSAGARARFEALDAAFRVGFPRRLLELMDG